jgi:hypothetical protein
VVRRARKRLPLQSWLLLKRQFAEKFEYNTTAIRELVDRLPETMRFEVAVAQKVDGPVKQIVLSEIADTVKVGDVTYNLGGAGCTATMSQGYLSRMSVERFWI